MGGAPYIRLKQGGGQADIAGINIGHYKSREVVQIIMHDIVG